MQDAYAKTRGNLRRFVRGPDYTFNRYLLFYNVQVYFGGSITLTILGFVVTVELVVGTTITRYNMDHDRFRHNGAIYG